MKAGGKFFETLRFFFFPKNHTAVTRHCFAEGMWDQIRARKRCDSLKRALSELLKSHIATYWSYLKAWESTQ